MRHFFKRLSTAWLILALVVTPLQALASPVAQLAGNDCPMAQMDQQNLHADQAAPACPHCVDHSCDDGQCAANGCFSANLPLNLTAALQFAGNGSGPVMRADSDRNNESLNIPPLLRPPVV